MNTKAAIALTASLAIPAVGLTGCNQSDQNSNPANSPNQQKQGYQLPGQQKNQNGQSQKSPSNMPGQGQSNQKGTTNNK